MIYSETRLIQKGTGDPGTSISLRLVVETATKEDPHDVAMPRVFLELYNHNTIHPFAELSQEGARNIPAALANMAQEIERLMAFYER